MLLDRRCFLFGASALAASVGLPTVRARAEGGVSAILRAALGDPENCGRRRDAIIGTLARLDRAAAPTSGRSIVVDIPSQTLTAYDGRTPSMESVVVVGDPGWQTPDLETTVEYVRFNPTWTVPTSIVEARDWRVKLAANPKYFQRLNFKVMVGGRLVDPEEGAENAGAVTRFVQQAGAGNALGRVKLGLRSSGGVYLHDTNDQGAFDEDARALSHGCVRVEQALKLAAWTLGIDEAEASRLLADNDQKDRAPPGSVRLATTYFTAWPDANGKVVFYDDVYRRDGRHGTGGGCATASRAREEPFTEYEEAR